MSRPNPSKSSSHVPSSGPTASSTRPLRRIPRIPVLREPSARRDSVPSRGYSGPVATNTSRQDQLSMVRAYPAPSDRAPSLARASRNLDVYERANYPTGTNVNASGTEDDKPIPDVDGLQGSAISDHHGAYRTGLVEDASDPEPPTENNTPSSFATTLSDHEDDDSRVASSSEGSASNTGFWVERGQASRSNTLPALNLSPARHQNSLRTIRGDEDATTNDSLDTVRSGDNSWDEGVARIYPDGDAADEEDEDTNNILAGLDAFPRSESSGGDLSWDEGVARIEYNGDAEDEDEEDGGTDNILAGLDVPSTSGNRKTSRG